MNPQENLVERMERAAEKMRQSAEIMERIYRKKPSKQKKVDHSREAIRRKIAKKHGPK